MKTIPGILLLLVITGCSSRIIPPGENKTSELSKRALTGQIIFMQRCNRCHPGGMSGLGPSIINKPLPGFVIKFQVRKGLGAMPSFSKEQLPKQNLDDLVFYLKNKKKR